MMTKKFRFIFTAPITCYGEIITEDSVIASDLKKALKILKREHHHAKVAEVEVTEIELYTNELKYAESTIKPVGLLNVYVD